MEFTEFARRVERVEELKGDHEKTAEVADLLSAAEDDVDVVARFVQGRVFPGWSQHKLDVGPALLYEAISLASGASEQEIEEVVRETGDPGDAAAKLEFGSQQTLGGGADTVDEVYRAFERLADESGEGSQRAKVRVVADLLMDADDASARYVARLVLGEMRVGVGEGTVRDAVAEAYDVDVEAVERALMLTNDCGRVAETARVEGEKGLRALDIEVGRPVKPMLAQQADVEDLFDDLGDEAAVEWKYDGARVQVHVDGTGEVSLYSRRMEELTESLPDVVEQIESEVEDDVVLDGEVVATEDGEPMPFQELLRRLRRKYDVRETQEEVSVEVQLFDVLYRGEALLDETLEHRRRVLEEAGGDLISPSWRESSMDGVRRVERESLDAGHEGIMAKSLDSTYSPGRRGRNWLKLKPEPETLDVAVVGGEWGEGRRTDLIGSYHLAVRGDGDLLKVGNVATGFTDEDLDRLTETFEDLVVQGDGMEVEFEPKVVFEVGYEEIQTSPEYDSGFALRFPRFLGVRRDKDVKDVDSLGKLERLYR